MILKPNPRRRTPGSRAADGWAIASLAALALAADAVTLVRLHAFEADPPPMVRVDARIEVLALHKRGTILQVEMPTGWICLTTGPANVLGAARSGIDVASVTQDAVARVAWIDAPGNLAHWTVHYPVHLEQAGRVLLHVDSPADVAAAERDDVLQEVVGAAVVFVIAMAYGLRARRRERQARTPA